MFCVFNYSNIYGGDFGCRLCWVDLRILGRRFRSWCCAKEVVDSCMRYRFWRHVCCSEEVARIWRHSSTDDTNFGKEVNINNLICFAKSLRSLFARSN